MLSAMCRDMPGWYHLRVCACASECACVHVCVCVCVCDHVQMLGELLFRVDNDSCLANTGLQPSDRYNNKGLRDSSWGSAPHVSTIVYQTHCT